MKLVIPFLYKSDTISVDAHKMLLTTLKSYIYNANTTPIVIAITHEETKYYLNKFINNEKCQDIISYEMYTRDEVFKDNYLYKTYGHHFGVIAMAKYFCIENVAKDDDIIMCDSDMLFLRKIDFQKHISLNAKIQYFENYYENSTCSGNIGIFINRCAIEANYDVNKFMNQLRLESKKPIDSKMPWPNGGLLYFSKEYRNNEFHNDLLNYQHSLWFKIHLYEEEPLYLYLYHNTDKFFIEHNSSLNVRIYTFANKDIFDPLDIPNVDMLHYCMPKCKPSEYQFTQIEGHIIRNQKESIYDVSPEGTIWMEFFTRTATTRILLVLWHFYYSMVTEYISQHGEWVHYPETFKNLMINYKEINEKLKAINTTNF